MLHLILKKLCLLYHARRLDAGFLWRRLAFNSRQCHVKFGVDEVALGQISRRIITLFDDLFGRNM
jgi:hypothetical protein